MPASYALEALQQVGAHPELTAVAVRDMVVVSPSRSSRWPGGRHPAPADSVT